MNMHFCSNTSGKALKIRLEPKLMQTAAHRRHPKEHKLANRISTVVTAGRRLVDICYLFICSSLKYLVTTDRYE